MPRMKIRAALAWTRGAADREHDFAETLVLRIPAVFAALDTGRICRSKAWVFADLCIDLTADQAEVVYTAAAPGRRTHDGGAGGADQEAGDLIRS